MVTWLASGRPASLFTSRLTSLMITYHDTSPRLLQSLEVPDIFLNVRGIWSRAGWWCSLSLRPQDRPIYIYNTIKILSPDTSFSSHCGTLRGLYPRSIWPNNGHHALPIWEFLWFWELRSKMQENRKIQILPGANNKNSAWYLNMNRFLLPIVHPTSVWEIL